MFKPEERDALRSELIEAARCHSSFTEAAITGSASVWNEDHWSDIDLAFGVRKTSEVATTLNYFTERMYRDNPALHEDVKLQLEEALVRHLGAYEPLRTFRAATSRLIHDISNVNEDHATRLELTLRALAELPTPGELRNGPVPVWRAGSCRAVHRAVALGVNYIDAAPDYADSEVVLGRIVPGVEGPLVVSTKIRGHPKPFLPQDRDCLTLSIEESLLRLKQGALARCYDEAVRLNSIAALIPFRPFDEPGCLNLDRPYPGPGPMRWD